MRKGISRPDFSWIMPEEAPYHSFFLKRFRLECEDLRLFLDEDCKAHPWLTASGSDNVVYSSRILSTLLDVFCRSQRPQYILLVAGWHRIRYIFIIVVLALTRTRYVFWTDTPSIGRNRSVLISVFRFLISRLVFSSADYVLSTGLPGMRNLKAMGCPARKVINFPFFVPLSEISHKSEARWKGIPTFVSAGRLLNSVKGCEIALRAVSLAITRYGRPLRYRIAGEGPDRRKLESLAEELNISKCVEFLGWVGTERLRRELEAADCLVHSALYDPFPVVVLEAMASGCVVLGSDVSGSVRDRVIPGVNGLVHRAGSVVALAEHIVYICEHRERAREMGYEAKRTASKWTVETGINIMNRATTLGAERIL